jgi:glycerophosphoryl diester phosphodiesterase
MDVIAHRGFADEGVENALSTLVAAADRADAVEFDVRLAADGEPVVIHDATVDRLTDAEGPVDSYTAAELGELSLRGTDEGIPTLQAVLEALSGPIVAELKTQTVPDRLVELLTDYDGPVTVSSFRAGTLRALPASIDRAVLCAPDDHGEPLPDGVTVGLEDGRSVATGLDAAGIHLHHSLCTPAAVADCQAAGLAVAAWTVRSRETAAAMRAAGVDAVIADSPAYVAED